MVQHKYKAKVFFHTRHIGIGKVGTVELEVGVKSAELTSHNHSPPSNVHVSLVGTHIIQKVAKTAECEDEEVDLANEFALGWRAAVCRGQEVFAPLLVVLRDTESLSDLMARTIRAFHQYVTILFCFRNFFFVSDLVAHTKREPTTQTGPVQPRFVGICVAFESRVYEFLHDLECCVEPGWQPVSDRMVEVIAPDSV